MRVLFVCVHNAGRSQMAEAYVNYFARLHNLDWFAESAGTVGGKSLNSIAIQAMEEDGVSMDGQSPKLITQAHVDRADKIISMGCGVDAASCPAEFLLTEDWLLEDPAGLDIEEVRIIRDQIRERVVDLLDCRAHPTLMNRLDPMQTED